MSAASIVIARSIPLSEALCARQLVSHVSRSCRSSSTSGMNNSGIAAYPYLRPRQASNGSVLICHRIDAHFVAPNRIGSHAY